MAVTIDGTNGITSPDFEPSSSTTPTNGLFLPTTNALGFATNSTERLRLDSSGNLGLGVTPSTWSAGKSIEVGNAGDGVSINYGYGLNLNRNAYYNGGFKYGTSDYASRYAQASGQHQWYNAPSGTAGAAISFTQAMTLDASGNLGLGVTSPLSRLDVRVSSGEVARFALSGTTPDAVKVMIGKASNTAEGLQLEYDGSTGNSAVNSVYASGALIFKSANTERARIDSSGNLLVGTTDLNPFSGNGFKFTPNGGAGSGIGQLSLVGNSATAGVTALTLYSTSASNYRFYVDYAGTVYARTGSISVISDQREKTNIRALETGLSEVLSLIPRRFDWVDGSKSDVAGFIAQEVQEVLPDLIDVYKDAEERISLRTGDMIPTLVKAIQELSAKVTALEAK